MRFFTVSSILATTAALVFGLNGLGTPTTEILSGPGLGQKTGAQGPPPQLFDESCQLLDTKAACDVANDLAGPLCSTLYAICEYCDSTNPANTNESEMCFFEESQGCAPKTSGSENDCGTLMRGMCLWDDAYNLVCEVRPGDPCANILEDGC